MLYAPTHLVDVLTGTTTDDYGDATDGTTVAAASVPVSILERTKRVFRADSDTPGVIRFLVGRAPAGTPVAQGDRLRAADGTTWIVDAATTPTNPVMAMDMTLDLRRV